MTRICKCKASWPTNWAESLLGVGQAVGRCVRRGVPVQDVARRLQCTTDYCRLALAFTASSDLLKLRSMVENWSVQRITGALDGPNINFGL